MRLLFTLLIGLFLFNSTLHLQADIKWILLGTVLQKENLQPVKNMRVCLQIKKDSENSENCVTTLENGHFDFQLQADKQYWVHLLDTQSNIIKSKEICTLGKVDPEVMHVLFEY
ncbi:MAG: hypothetical protein ACPGVB_16640 [Chitinophagales bacterium]